MRRWQFADAVLAMLLVLLAALAAIDLAARVCRSGAPSGNQWETGLPMCCASSGALETGTAPW